MNCLFLTLKGTMRSWGATSIGDDRWTSQWPTASAILGLTGACMGVDQYDPEQMSAWYNGFLVCSASAVSYQNQGYGQSREYHPALEADYQTVRNSLNMNGKRRKETIVSHRGYIADGLEVSVLIPVHNAAEDWLQQLVFAVQQPHYTPCLGRKAQPLSVPLAEPGERVETVSSAEQISGKMIARLSRLSIGDLQPTRCMLRLPMEIIEDSAGFSEKWCFAGEELIADHRTGFFRTFKDRRVYKFYADMPTE